MPLDKDNPQLKKGGRKGYEYEEKQLETMRRILNKDLKIVERLQDAVDIDPIDEKKLSISQARISKYLDKLHVSKTHTDLTVKDEGTNLSPEALAIAKKYEDELKKTL